MGPEYFWGGGMWIFPIMFFALMMIVMIFFRRQGFRPPWMNSQGSGGNASKESSGQETALDILKKRFARGEIGKEEYEEMKKEL